MKLFLSSLLHSTVSSYRYVKKKKKMNLSRNCSCPVTGLHLKEPDSILFTAFLQVFTDIDEPQAFSSPA